MKQLRQREAEERRAARAAREQGAIDVNQIPLGEKVCHTFFLTISAADMEHVLLVSDMPLTVM